MKEGDTDCTGGGEGLLLSCGCRAEAVLELALLLFSNHSSLGVESEHIACECGCSRGPVLVPVSQSVFMRCKLNIGNLLGWRMRRPRG